MAHIHICTSFVRTCRRRLSEPMAGSMRVACRSLQLSYEPARVTWKKTDSNGGGQRNCVACSKPCERRRIERDADYGRGRNEENQK